MGVAVAERTVLRKTGKDNEWETWGDVAERVALGNTMIVPNKSWNQNWYAEEFQTLRNHIAQASILMSGRSLQHGDETQAGRNMEVFTNCSTAALSHLLYYLLLNGSGVGRSYDDALMVVNWDDCPEFICAMSKDHADYQEGAGIAEIGETLDALTEAGRPYSIFKVEDSREGWARAVEHLEIVAAYGEAFRVSVLDFSDVRPKGSPIMGMQGRPSSGPVPMIHALNNIKKHVLGKGMSMWKQAMFVDHFLADCVVVGGARRASRMATKFWKDPEVLEFISIKKDYLDEYGFPILWSSNNSVCVDSEFWSEHKTPGTWASKVFEAMTHAAYFDKTGEPGLINYDKLQGKEEDLRLLYTPEAFSSPKYPMNMRTYAVMEDILFRAESHPVKYITNPCGEIVLRVTGGYCVIADVVPYFAKDDNDAEDAFRSATRALLRLNRLPCLYNGEVKRTNRIGVGFTGIHEFAFKRFGFGFLDLIDEEKSIEFWMLMRHFSDVVRQEADTYSFALGVNEPHTCITVKPAGTTSKLFGLSEGAHLPGRREYLRWVQFRNEDPLVQDYKQRGYPVKELKSYQGTTIVGFPTTPTIMEIGMGDKLMTASEATPEQHYQWLKLLEKYWIGTHDTKGNQVSYTLRYDSDKVSYEDYQEMLGKHQSQIRCCAVMPEMKVDKSLYEYLPEEDRDPYDMMLIKARIAGMTAELGSLVSEVVDEESLLCSSGACPI
jgi:adenosylcobalamin-dependent ribonucleoside-triphosphate reductase